MRINSCLDFVAHDDEPYTIGSSSVSIPRLTLSFEPFIAKLMSRDCYLSKNEIKFKTLAIELLYTRVILIIL